jgi:hypothetical protein
MTTREERVRLYGEASVAEGERPYTHADLDRDYDNSCDHGSSAIRIDRIRATIEDNARLRALIKAHLIERVDGEKHGDGRDPTTIWFRCLACGDYYEPSPERAVEHKGLPAGARQPHAADCPAFTPEGTVK